MWRRIWEIIVKEFIELKRDRSARFRLIVPPIIQILVFGYAATFEVFDVNTAVLDLDHSQESREILSRFTFSSRFHVVEVDSRQSQIDSAINASDVAVAIVIHPGFAQLLRNGQGAPLQVIVDGTNSNTALIALGYVNQIVAGFSQDYAAEAIRHSAIPSIRPVQVTLEQRPWYNADLNGRWFFVPGVIGSLILVNIVGLTALAVVREREMGTLEQIMVTPIRPAELILGKTIPFFFVGLAEVTLVTAVGTIWFRIPFLGDPLVMLLGTSLFLLSALGMGLLISTVCATQQQAFATQFFVLNPMFILSGFAYPISSMPKLLQWLTYLNPLRYYLVVIRSTFLKGVGLGILWPNMIGMSALAVLLLGVSILRFRKSLD
jgi:ABC-2 type transport system permease protein